jgi:putative spermidine/putrescine transport system permease protein
MQNDPIERIGQGFAILAALICLVPLPLLLAVATTETWQQGLWAGGFTLRWLLQGWQTISPQVVYSVRVALLVLVLDIAISLPAAWVLARYRFPGREWLLALASLPIAIPGIAIALALILAYPTARAGGWLLIAGHTLYTLPFMLAALTPVLGEHYLREKEAVAATLGATPPQRFLWVTLPHCRRALLAAAILVVTLSMGEFNVSFFLFTPTAKTLPVDLYASYITGRLEVAAANTVWFLCFVVPAAIAIERLGGAKAGQV